MELMRSDSNFDFLGKRRYWIVFSALTVIASIYIWFARGDGKYSIDFTGGHEIVIDIPGDTDVTKVSEALQNGGVVGAEVQSFERGSNDYSVRIAGAEDGSDAKAIKEKIESTLKNAFGKEVSILKSDSVGPTVGRELKFKALIAILLGLAGILVYVSVRFEFAFALGAVVALFHDVIVSTGVYLLAGHDLNMGSLAAALTIVGYSVNDTIVIFDRIREEMNKRKDVNLEQLMNECINFTLSRTIITSLLTLFSALALLTLGGGSLQDLSLYLVAGLIAGCYSTIYIASPIVLWWVNLRAKKAQNAAARQTPSARVAAK